MYLLINPLNIITMAQKISIPIKFLFTWGNYYHSDKNVFRTQAKYKERFYFIFEMIKLDLFVLFLRQPKCLAIFKFDKQ